MATHPGGPNERPRTPVSPQLEHLELLVLDSRPREVMPEYCEVLALGTGRAALVHAIIGSPRETARTESIRTRELVRDLCTGDSRSLEELAGELNSRLYETTRPGYFTCLFLGVYDDATQSLHYISCGHEAPVLLRRDGTVERLDVTGVPLGMMETIPFESSWVCIAPGDMFFAFSELLVDEIEGIGPFRAPSVLTLIQSTGGASPALVVDALLCRLREVRNRTEADDMAILAARAV